MGKKEVKSGTAVVARVESCALMFYVATERQGLEIWKSWSQTQREGVFMLCLLLPYSPGGQHDVYIE